MYKIPPPSTLTPDVYKKFKPTAMDQTNLTILNIPTQSKFPC